MPLVQNMFKTQNPQDPQFVMVIFGMIQLPELDLVVLQVQQDLKVLQVRCIYQITLIIELLLLLEEMLQMQNQV